MLTQDAVSPLPQSTTLDNMIETLSIKNFQSLHDVSLTLRPLTVIVGPSSSGKSALTRALRLLTSNARGTAFVSTGSRTAQVTATTERGTVSIKRGGENEYVVVTPIKQQTFTKLAAAVPPEVTAFLGIAPNDPLNFSSQFDKPYLLDDTPAEVARTLGALTNVSVILEAAREANRRRLALSSTLRTRVEDEAALTQEKEHLSLTQEQSEHLEAAERILDEVAVIESTIYGLEQAAELLKEAAARLQGIKEIRIPDIAAVLQAHDEHRKLSASVTELQQAASKLQATTSALEAANKNLEQAQQQLAIQLLDLERDIEKYLTPHGPTLDVPTAAHLSAEYINFVLL